MSALTGCCNGLRVIEFESGVCVHIVRVVHECVQAGDGCKSLCFFKGAKMNLDALSLTLSREPRKKNSERVTACTGVRRGWKCAVVDGVLFTHTVGHFKIAIFGDRCSLSKRK